MKTTDYSKIADRYDANPIRAHWAREPLIAQALETAAGEVRVLDLACGTGNYTAAQRVFFPTARIRWFGCDRSVAMLERARAKLPFAVLQPADAAALPYAAGFFHLVVCNFAFHHFREKAGSVREIERVLIPGGVFLLSNVCPELMSDWWVYRYFPAARGIDRRRFWKIDRLKAVLAKIGFSVETAPEVSRRTFSAVEIEAEVLNRDMSQLTLISERQYRRGLARMKDDIRFGRTRPYRFALVRLVARKKEV